MEKGDAQGEYPLLKRGNFIYPYRGENEISIPQIVGGKEEVEKPQGREFSILSRPARGVSSTTEGGGREPRRRVD